MDEIRISPAGDGFYAAAKHRSSEATAEETPHGCYDGWVYLGQVDLGQVDLGEDGEEAELVEAVPCRRCRPEDL